MSIKAICTLPWRRLLAGLFIVASSADLDAARIINFSGRQLIPSEGATVTLRLQGAGTRTLLIRGVGPGLSAVGIGGRMNDPRISLFDDTSALIASNDDWGGSAAISTAAAQVGAFSLPFASKDAALLITLPAGHYTVRLFGAVGEAGVAMLEVYDTGGDETSRLSYAGFLGVVSTGNPIYGGFVTSTPGFITALIRAMGPGIKLNGALANPRFTVHQITNFGASLVAQNDDWGSNSNLGSIITSVNNSGGLPFDEGGSDAAVLSSFPEGPKAVTVTAADGGAGKALLEVFDLTVAEAQKPFFLGAASAQSTSTGSTFTFSAIAGGSLPISYQWRKNGVPVSGATAANLTLANVTAADAGAYDVLASNTVGETISPTQTLALAVPSVPTIAVPPAAQTVTRGQDATFSVLASGVPSVLNYQWRKNGINIPGAAAAQFTLSNIQPVDAGTYDVIVSNAAGPVTSAGATLTLAPLPPPLFVTQPASGLFILGNMARFSVTVSGAGPITFQWRKNGQPILGAITSQLIFPVSTVGDSAVYDVVAMGPDAAAVSAPATLSVAQLPWYSQPASRFARLGESITFLSGPAGLQYQWAKDGIAVPDATAATLTIPAVSASSLGNYSVTVGDGVSGVVNRGPVRLALRGEGTFGRQFVAVGNAGTLLTSSDGVNWISRATGVLADLRGVAVAGDAAVAVGAGGVILNSSDGTTWTAIPSNSSIALNSVTAGPDRFVAVGDAGRVVVSPNGIDWFVADSRTTANLLAVTYRNGLYAMAGNGGALFTSADGFSWTNRNSETTSQIRFVTFDTAQFWALTATNDLLVSSDGITWARTPASPPGWFRGLAYGGAKFVTVGDAGNISTSSDGAAWTAALSGTSQNIAAIGWSGPEIPTGPGPANLLSDLNFRLLSSPVSFSVVPGQSANFSVRASGGALTYQWMKNGTPLPDAVQAELQLTNVGPGDAGDYTVRVTAPSGTLESAPAKLGVVGSSPLGGKFIAVGEDGTVLSSLDGNVFTTRATNPGKTLRAVASSALRAVAVGRFGAAAVSDDGINWSFRTLPLPSQTMRGLAAGPTQFVAVGSRGVILLSLDQGESWQPVISGTGQSLWGVAWNGSRFLAVGEGGVALTSPDGLAWQPVTAPTSDRLYTVTANGTMFVAVTDDGRAFMTANAGESWQAIGVSGALWVRGATIGSAGRRVVVGDLGLIASSTNGADWIRQTSPATDRLYGVVWTGLPAALSNPGNEAINGPALRITGQPVSSTTTSGGTATFSVIASGVSPLTYQWRREGTAIPGATNPTLILSNVLPADAGSYTVAVFSLAETVVSDAAILTVTSPMSGIAPAISFQPENRIAVVGGSVTFTVAANGTIPLSYQWRFNGTPISGAVLATLSLSNLQLANSGSYAVTVSNAFGNVLSNAASLTVGSAPGSPAITTPPVGQSVSAGATVTLSVGASGAGLSYQWRKEGIAIPGATAATLILQNVTPSQAGSYTVVVSNASGTVISDPVGITVVPAGMAAIHHQIGGVGYVPGSTITISSGFTYVGFSDSSGWQVLLPDGWSYAGGGGSEGDVKPQPGDTQLLSWAWTTTPPSPINFTYTLNIPSGASGTYALAALAIVRQGGVPIQMLGQPDPLFIVPGADFHSGDTNGDRRLSLNELLRVIELYNTRNGSVRTGAYALDSENVEDGFATAPARSSAAVVTLSRYHSADSSRDGKLGLTELLRVIELYNYRTGTVRTGQYHAQAGTEDGFAPGP